MELFKILRMLQNAIAALFQVVFRLSSPRFPGDGFAVQLADHSIIVVQNGNVSLLSAESVRDEGLAEMFSFQTYSPDSSTEPINPLITGITAWPPYPPDVGICKCCHQRI